MRTKMKKLKITIFLLLSMLLINAQTLPLEIGNHDCYSGEASFLSVNKDTFYMQR